MRETLTLFGPEKRFPIQQIPEEDETREESSSSLSKRTFEGFVYCKNAKKHSFCDRFCSFQKNSEVGLV
jgi:hypothetical protein